MLATTYEYIQAFFTVIGGLTSLWAMYVGVRTKLFPRTTWRSSVAAAKKMLEQIEQGNWKPDIVVGIGRSGALWGGWLAGNLGSTPIAVVDCSYGAHSSTREPTFVGLKETLRILRKAHPLATKIVAIEGAASSGLTFIRFEQFIKREWPECDLRLASLYANKGVPVAIAFVGERDFEPWPDVFPWHLRTVYRRFLRQSIAKA